MSHYPAMQIGNRTFRHGKKTYVMGILNVTPDSFSDGGTHDTVTKALAHTEKLLAEGADIIDIGGESTRPGHVQISIQEEINRVVPVIEGIKKRFNIPVSVDTYKGDVARAALDTGADLLNDIWGFKYDENCAKYAAEYKVAVCLMHNRNQAEYNDFVPDVLSDLQESVKIAKKYGIADNKIMLDPGIGFGKTLAHNLIIMNHLEDVVSLGYPVLLGTSRKSMIGLTLDLPVDEREEGTLATSVIGAMKGCDYVRVHDVEKNVRALKMTDAILHRED